MNENEQRIFELVKANTLRVLAEVQPDQVTPDTALVDLGANSIDRVEVAMYSMEDLNLKVPMGALQGVTNLRSLVELLARHDQSRGTA